MIKYNVNNELLHLSIDKTDFSFRIPLQKLKKPISWKIGSKEVDGIVLKNVSKWTVQLFTRGKAEDKHVQQFKEIVQEVCPKNSIDWKETLLAVQIQSKYNWRMESKEERLTEEEVIRELEDQFDCP